MTLFSSFSRYALLVSIVLLTGAAGCSSSDEVISAAPDVAPASQPAGIEPLELDSSQIRPLHLELVAIDLESTLRVAAASNLDIHRARLQVEQLRGRLESAVGGVFPAIVPTAVFEHVEGTVRAVRGELVGVGFNTFLPSVAVQWVTNPGSVIYEIIAARKRLRAGKQEEQSVVQETLRQAGVQYYELVLAQSRVGVAHEALKEAEELLRINRLRTRTGIGVPSDEMRAEARLAERHHDLISAIHSFYEASVALAVTLHLDSAVTLIPKPAHLPAITLVDPDLSLDRLLELAVVLRPDLDRARALVKAAAAAEGATWWGAFGPQFQISYQYGGIMGHTNNVAPAQGIPNNLIVNPASPGGSFSSNPLANGLIREGISRASLAKAGRGDESYGMHDQQRMGATAGWRFSLSAIGDLRSSGAIKEQAILEAEQVLDRVKAQVVLAREASRAQLELIGLAERQTSAANETLRLSKANLQAGMMTTLDVLQAQDAANQARLRHAEAIVRYNQAQLNLLAALGAVPAVFPQPATAPSGPESRQ